MSIAHCSTTGGMLLNWRGTRNRRMDAFATALAPTTPNDDTWAKAILAEATVRPYTHFGRVPVYPARLTKDRTA